MSFASVANTSATGAGLNYPCELIENGNNPIINLVKSNTLYTITTNRGGNNTVVYLPAPENAKIGDWLTIIYFSGDAGDTISVLTYAGDTIVNVVNYYEPLLFAYVSLPIIAGGAGWVTLSFF